MTVIEPEVNPWELLESTKHLLAPHPITAGFDAALDAVGNISRTTTKGVAGAGLALGITASSIGGNFVMTVAADGMVEEVIAVDVAQPQQPFVLRDAPTGPEDFMARDRVDTVVVAPARSLPESHVVEDVAPAPESLSTPPAVAVAPSPPAVEVPIQPEANLPEPAESVLPAHNMHELDLDTPLMYVTAKGETFSHVAAAMGITEDELAERNPRYKDAAQRNFLREAAKLNINPNSVAVVEIDGFEVLTLSHVAKITGLSIKHLADTNGIANPALVQSGQIIKIIPLDTSDGTQAEMVEMTEEATAKLSGPLPEPAPVVTSEPAPTPPPAEATPAPEPAPAAPVSPVSQSADSVNIDAIPAVGGYYERMIEDFARFLINRVGLTPRGAAYFIGYGLAESGLDPNAYNASEGAEGILQWRGGRRNGMPAGDRNAQAEWGINIESNTPDGGAPGLDTVLRDPNATTAEVQEVLQDWIRYGHEGSRHVWGDQIFAAMMTPLVPPPAPEQAPAPAPPPPPTPEPAPAPQPPPVETAPQPEATQVPEELRHSLIDATSLREAENGDGVPIMIVRVEGEWVSARIALKVAQIIEAAAADGIDIGITSGWRSIQEQRNLRKQNDCPEDDNAPARYCRIPTAPPGRSEHNNGEALDLNTAGDDMDNRTFAWLQAHAAEFGFYNLESEPWHWSTSGN